MNTICKIIYGSHLYGTAIETSDNDFRSVYLPTLNECVLHKIRAAFENKSEDDSATFSFQKYMNILREGQNIAIEMLCAPNSAILSTSPIWDELRKNRQAFFSKRMHSFCSYSRNMVSKYSLRIERMNESKAALQVIKDNFKSENIKLYDIWDKLPVGEFLEKTINERQNTADNRVYNVCGRQIQATVPLRIALEVLTKLEASYGARVRASEDNTFDYKSIGHAFRVLFQIVEIIETNDLKYPLKNAEWLRSVRLGQYHFVNDGLQEKLDTLLMEAEGLLNKSNLPETINRDIVEKIVLQAYGLA